MPAWSGLLLAALYHPVWTSAIHAPADFALALAAFGLLALWRVPPWLVVAFAAAGGAAIAAFASRSTTMLRQGGARAMRDGMAQIKFWTDGVEVEDEAMAQIRNVASLPIVAPHVAIMPDVHWGIGATVGSVIPTRGAIIPAAVGVDIGCGMMAVRTNVAADALHLARLRAEIEDAIPVGGPGVTGSWAETRFGEVPAEIRGDWRHALALGWANIVEEHPKLARSRRGATAPTVEQLGTLGTGNHFIEVCVEPAEAAPRCGSCCTRARAGRAIGSAPTSSSAPGTHGTATRTGRRSRTRTSRG